MNSPQKIPFTRTSTSPEQANAIRRAVQQATAIPTDGPLSRLAKPADAPAFFEFLQDPAIYAPIYSLPTPLTLENVTAFIVDYEAQRSAGTGLLFFSFTPDGALSGYTDLTLWAEWGAGELGGAVHPNRQGQRKGVDGARRAFEWMFNALGVDLICETAALDNVRTARLLDSLGFRRVGKTISTRADGTTRPSLVWEVTSEEWSRLHPEN